MNRSPFPFRDFVRARDNLVWALDNLVRALVYGGETYALPTRHQFDHQGKIEAFHHRSFHRWFVRGFVRELRAQQVDLEHLLQRIEALAAVCVRSKKRLGSGRALTSYFAALERQISAKSGKPTQAPEEQP